MLYKDTTYHVFSMVDPDFFRYKDLKNQQTILWCLVANPCVSNQFVLGFCIAKCNAEIENDPLRSVPFWTT